MMTVLRNLFTRKNKYAGFIDSIFLFGTRLHISGWAYKLKGKSTDPLKVDIYNDGKLVATTECNLHRPDLEELGYGDGCHGFQLILDTVKLSLDLHKNLYAKAHDSRFKLKDANISTNLDKLVLPGQKKPFPVTIITAGTGSITGEFHNKLNDLMPESVKLVSRNGVLVSTCNISGSSFSFRKDTVPEQQISSDLYLLSGTDNSPLLMSPVYIADESASEGQVDSIGENSISGWAFMHSTCYKAVTVLAYTDEGLIGYARADKYRIGVISPFSNEGFCGFSLSTKRPLAQKDIETLYLRIAETEHYLSIPEHVRETAARRLLNRTSGKNMQANIVGHLEKSTRQFIKGWAVNVDAPAKSVIVDLYIDSCLFARVKPDINRPDVTQRFNLRGNFGFVYEIPAGLALEGSHEINAVFHESGKALINSPISIIFGLSGKELFAIDNIVHPSYTRTQDGTDNYNPSLGIIVLNRNGGHHLETLFSSFQQYNTYSDYKFYIVDHHSTDESLQICEQWQDRLNLHIIKRGHNYSYSTSNNYAAGNAQEDILLFLNNDISFTGDILTEAVSCFKDPDLGILGIKLLNDFGSESVSDAERQVQHLGIRFDFTRTGRTFLPYEIMDLKNNPEYTPAGRILPAVTAAFMLIRRPEFLEINGFDEGYYYGFEDVDLCLTYSRFFDKKIICATDLYALHKTSSTRSNVSAAEKRLIARNFSRLNQRLGRYLVNNYRRNRATSISNLTGRRFRLGFAVSGTSLEIKEGDLFTAYELGKELGRMYGWEIRYLGPDEWYELKGFDAVVAMRHDYNPLKIQNQGPYLIRIAWLRNWFDGWINQGSIRDYDIIWCASSKALDKIKQRTGAMVRPLYIATNPETFSPGPSKSEYTSDYCFTGSFYNAPRQIIFDLEPASLPYDFAVYGSNWEKIQKFRDHHRGHIPYRDLADLYRSTKLVLDDANHTVKGWGSPNSRVFDALATGTLLITNDWQASCELFDGMLPSYSNREELNELISRYLGNDELRGELTRQLRDIVLARHTYENRARNVFDIIHAYDTVSLRIGIVTHPEMISAGNLAGPLLTALVKQGYIVHRRTPSSSDRNLSLGDDIIIFISDQNTTPPLPYIPDSHHYNILLFNGSFGYLTENITRYFDEVILVDNPGNISCRDGSRPIFHTLEVTDYPAVMGSTDTPNVSRDLPVLQMEARAFSRRAMAFFHEYMPRIKQNIINQEPVIKSFNQGKVVHRSVSIKYFPDLAQSARYQDYLYGCFPYYFDIGAGSIDASLRDIKEEDRKSVFHLHAISTITSTDESEEITRDRINTFLVRLDSFSDLGGLFIWTVRDYPFDSALPENLQHELYQSLFDRAHVIHLFNQDAFTGINDKFKINKDKILITRHGFYSNEARTSAVVMPENYPDIPDDARIILIHDAGNFTESDKTIHDLQNLAKTSKQKIIFVIYRQMQSQNERSILETGHLPDCMHYIPGYISRDLLGNLIDTADFMLIPELNIHTYEAIVLSISCGLPVIAPDTLSTRQLINHKTTGILFNSKAPGSLIDATTAAAGMTADDYALLCTALNGSVEESHWNEASATLVKQIEIFFAAN
jgi:GT2 family glycosyltransferase